MFGLSVRRFSQCALAALCALSGPAMGQDPHPEQEKLRALLVERLGQLARRVAREAESTTRWTDDVAEFSTSHFNRAIRDKNFTGSPTVKWALEESKNDLTKAMPKSNSNKNDFLRDLTRGRLSGAANSMQEYSRFLQQLKRDSALLPPQAIIERLQSVYVPPEISVVLENDSSDQPQPPLDDIEKR